MDRCTRAEALTIVKEVDRLNGVDPARLERLRTLSDEDLTSLCTSLDAFVIAESNRRISVRLQTATQRTTRLTWGVFVLTGVLVVMDVVLVWLTLRHA